MNPGILKQEKITVEIFEPDGRLKERSVWVTGPQLREEETTAENETKGEMSHDS